MANTNSPFGLRPLRNLDSTVLTLTAYTIAAAYSTPIGQGDPVQMSGTGRNVILAEAGNQDNIGGFMGCQYTNAKGELKWSNYWTGESNAANIVCWVNDNPYTVFEMQSTTQAEVDVGQLVDWNAGTLNTATGMSGAYIVGATMATTGKALRLLGLSRKLNNDYGAYAKMEVMFVAHVLRSVVSSVGGI